MPKDEMPEVITMQESFVVNKELLTNREKDEQQSKIELSISCIRNAAKKPFRAARSSNLDKNTKPFIRLKRFH